MISPSFEHLRWAVLALGAVTLGAAVVIFLYMEVRFRRQRVREARRIILASRISPTSHTFTPEAFWSLRSRSDRELVLEVLLDMCRSPRSPTCRAAQAAIVALGVHDQWIWQLQTGRSELRERAATNLGYIPDEYGMKALVAAAGDKSPEVRLAVTLSLGRLSDPAGLPALIRLVGDPERAVADLTLAAALAACARRQPGLLAEPLRSGSAARLRVLAAWAISEIADKNVLPDLITSIYDAEPEVRAKVARALGRINSTESLQALRALAADPIWFVRVRAMAALGQIADPAAEDILMRGLDDKVRDVRYRAATALRLIHGMNPKLASQILATASRRAFRSLISEWDRAGFLSQVLAGLEKADGQQFVASRETVRGLVAAGMTAVLVNFMRVYPSGKVRWRLLRALRESASPVARAELLALAGESATDRRLAAAILRAYPNAAPKMASEPYAAES